MYSDVDFPQNDEIQKQEIWNNFRKSQESNVFPSLLATAKAQAEVVLQKQLDVDGFPQQAQHILIIIQFHLIKSSE